VVCVPLSASTPNRPQCLDSYKMAPMIARNASIHTKCTCSNDFKRYSIYSGLCTMELATTKGASCRWMATPWSSTRSILSFAYIRVVQDGRWKVSHPSRQEDRAKTGAKSIVARFPDTLRLRSNILLLTCLVQIACTRQSAASIKTKRAAVLVRSSSIDPAPVTRLDLAVPQCWPLTLSAKR